MNELETESGVIGSILADESCLNLVEQLLSPSDFRLEQNRVIYETALALRREGHSADLLAIAGRVNERTKRYMLDLFEVSPTAANVELYATETRKASMWRSLREVGNALTGADVTTDPRQTIGETIRTLEDIEETDAAREVADPAHAINAFYAHRQNLEQGKGGLVRTGYFSLDQLLGGGMLPGRLYIVAARPGVGKTAFALNICDNVVKTSPVLFVSLEMSEEEIFARRIALLTGISASELMMNDELGFEKYQELKQAVIELNARPFYTNIKPSATMDDIRNLARKVKGIKLLVIDYFGLIRTTKKAATRVEAMTNVSGDLKMLARAMKIPVLCLAQLNRANTQRADPRPILSDLRDTGALEQDADAVIFLHRDSIEAQGQKGEEPVSTVPLDVILAKNRHGPVGTRSMSFNMERGRIRPAVDTRQRGKAVKQANHVRQTSMFQELKDPDPDIPAQWKEAEPHDQ